MRNDFAFRKTYTLPLLLGTAFDPGAACRNFGNPDGPDHSTRGFFAALAAALVPERYFHNPFQVQRRVSHALLLHLTAN